MKVDISFFLGLREMMPGVKYEITFSLDVEEGITINDLINILSLTEYPILVNNTYVENNYQLEQNDIISVYLLSRGAINSK